MEKSNQWGTPEERQNILDRVKALKQNNSGIHVNIMLRDKRRQKDEDQQSGYAKNGIEVIFYNAEGISGAKHVLIQAEKELEDAIMDKTHKMLSPNLMEALEALIY